MFCFKYGYILVIFAITLPMATNAQTDSTSVRNDSSSAEPDITALFEKETARKVELEEKLDIMVARKKALENRLANITANSAKTEKKAASTKREIEKLKSKKAYLQLAQLIKKRDSLSAAVKAKTEAASKIETEIAALNGDLAENSERMEELETVKENVGKDVIASHEAYLSKPFSKMDLQELERIKAECNRYADNKDVKAFMAKVELATGNKRTYDKATNALASKYDANAVNTAVRRLKAMKGCNRAQLSETSKAIAQLEQYGQCFNTVRNMLKYFNETKRAGEYTKYDWEIDKSSTVIKQASEAAKPIPYLRKAWVQFVKALNQNPNAHPDVEKEILGETR